MRRLFWLFRSESLGQYCRAINREPARLITDRNDGRHGMHFVCGKRRFDDVGDWISRESMTCARNSVSKITKFNVFLLIKLVKYLPHGEHDHARAKKICKIMVRRIIILMSLACTYLKVILAKFHLIKNSHRFIELVKFGKLIFSFNLLALFENSARRKRSLLCERLNVTYPLFNTRIIN